MHESLCARLCVHLLVSACMCESVCCCTPETVDSIVILSLSGCLIPHVFADYAVNARHMCGACKYGVHAVYVLGAFPVYWSAFVGTVRVRDY